MYIFINRNGTEHSVTSSAVFKHDTPTEHFLYSAADTNTSCTEG